jgi:hypothetical protein
MLFGKSLPDVCTHGKGFSGRASNRMTKDVLAKAFEPFFTTKEIGTRAGARVIAPGIDSALPDCPGALIDW